MYWLPSVVGFQTWPAAGGPFARDVHESVAMRATNQLASIDRKLRTLRQGVALREKPWRIPAMLNERYRLFGVWRSRIARGDMCRLRDALGDDKAGGQR